MQITESQLSTLRKYSSILLSEGMGDNDFTARIAKIISVSDKNNGVDSSGTIHLEIMSAGHTEQKELRVNSFLFDINEFKLENRDLDAEYNQFLLDLDVEISRCENNLVELETPETSRYYKNKNKTFIAKIKRNNKRVIKFINNF
jgi:hypothetical protein